MVSRVRPNPPEASCEVHNYLTLALRAPVLAALPWVVHGFSTRLGGASSLDGSRSARSELNLGKVAWDTPEHVQENRRRYLECLRAEGMNLILQNQIHSDLIRVLEAAPASGHTLCGDGWITDRKGLLLGILSADCLPVFVVDVRRRVIAALHCGWRGTARRLAQKAAGVLRQRFGSRPEDLRAAIGPGIRVCCYEVGEEVAAEFESQFLYANQLLRTSQKRQSNLERKYALIFQSPYRPAPARTANSIHLDLVEANLRQLEEGGIARERISANFPCTNCHPELFFSHRRDAGRSGRMIGAIGIRNSR